MQVTKDKVVTIEYTMKDNQGNLVDTTDNSEPLSFIQGRASLLPAIESAVEGLEMGKRITITLAPEQAYGHKDSSLITKVPRDHVDVPGELTVGLELKRKKGNRIIPITVVDFDDTSVTLDGNNPLAGTTLNVDLVIVEVRDAVEEELKSGKVQSVEELFKEEQERESGGVVVEFKP